MPMIALKIMGIVFAVLIVLICFILALRIRLLFSFDLKNAHRIKIKVLFFTFDLGKEKPKKSKKKQDKEKKPNAFIESIKKRLGLDFLKKEAPEAPKGDTLTDKLTGIISIITVFIGQVEWILRRFRLEKLRVFIVCGGGDAAEAAMEYGLVCAAVYPLIGYLSANLDAVENAEDVQVGCDFDGEPQLEFDFFVSIRVIHLLRAAFRAVADMSKAAELNQEAQQ